MEVGESREQGLLNDLIAPSIDLCLVADDDDVQLLSRLLRQNKALERLRRALDREEDDMDEKTAPSLKAFAD